jgi:hypothetical protein
MEQVMNNNVFVKSIEFISNESQEALLELSDGVYFCTAFCHPCNRSVGESIDEELCTLYASAIYLEKSTTTPYIESYLNGFGCKALGKLIDKENSIVQIGDIFIEMDSNLPGDLQNGDYVSFTCRRLDVCPRPAIQN